jgi:hypothetical protein
MIVAEVIMRKSVVSISLVIIPTSRIQSASMSRTLCLYLSLFIIKCSSTAVWGHWQRCGPRIAASGSIPGAPYLLSAMCCSASYGLLAGIGDVDFGSRLQAEFLTPCYTKFQIQESKSTAIWPVAHASKFLFRDCAKCLPGIP